MAFHDRMDSTAMNKRDGRHDNIILTRCGGDTNITDIPTKLVGKIMDNTLIPD
jgi:hypothetical protein